MSRYRQVDVEAISTGERVVVVRRADDRRLSLRPLDAHLLAGCDRFSALQAHAARLAPAVDRSPHEVRKRLQRLVRKELLHRPEDLIGGSPGGGVVPETVAFVTRDRPDCLARAVRSVLQAGWKRVQVYDDTANPAVQERARGVLADLAREHGAAVAWAGPADKDRYSEALAAAAGVDPELVAFALRGPDDLAWRPGANRNALLLGTIDQPVLSLDDDVVYRFAPVPDALAGVRAASGGGPQGHRFFPDAQAALEQARFSPFDARKALGEVLGRPVPAALAQADPTAGWWDDLSVARASRLDRSRVGLAVFGGVGDSGMASPHFALHLSGPARDRARAAWGMVRRSRGVLRAVRQATITDAPHLMSMAFALDTRQLLPPFCPVGRNADGLLGRALRVLQPDLMIAHLPRAIHHQPPEPRRYPDEAVWQGPLRLELVEVLMWACELRAAATGLEAAERYAAVGGEVTALGEAPPGVLEDLLRDRWWQRSATLADALDGLLRTADGAPEAWREDARRARDAQREAAASPPIPWEFRDRPRAAAIDRTRTVLRRYGALLQSWPALVAAARDLEPPARRLA